MVQTCTQRPKDGIWCLRAGKLKAVEHDYFLPYKAMGYLSSKKESTLWNKCRYWISSAASPARLWSEEGIILDKCWSAITLNKFGPEPGLGWKKHLTGTRLRYVLFYIQSFQDWICCPRTIPVCVCGCVCSAEARRSWDNFRPGSSSGKKVSW